MLNKENISYSKQFSVAVFSYNCTRCLSFRRADEEKSVTKEPGSNRFLFRYVGIGMKRTHSSQLGACSFENPQNKFAYETYLTSKEVQYTFSAAQLLSNLPSPDGEILRGDSKHLVLYDEVPITNNLNVSTLIDLSSPNYTNCYAKWRKANFVFTMVNADRLEKEVPGFRDDYFEANRYKQTQTERINFNKNRIDKPLKSKCQSTNNKNKFCELNRENFAKSTKIFPLREGEMSEGQRGFMATAKSLFSTTEPY